MDSNTDQHTSTNAPTSNKQKYFYIRKEIIIFLLGILTGIVVTALYALAMEEIKKRPTITANKPAPTVTPVPKEKLKVSEDELNNYVDAKDCSTLSEFSSLSMTLGRLTMKTISLDESLIAAGREGTTNYIRWKTLPAVVDYNCKPIKLSDIEAGDTLNIYSSRGTTDYSSDTRLIQKANK